MANFDFLKRPETIFILKTLSYADDLTAQQLTIKLNKTYKKGVSVSAIRAVLQKMEKAGLIEKHRLESDNVELACYLNKDLREFLSPLLDSVDKLDNACKNNIEMWKDVEKYMAVSKFASIKNSRDIVEKILENENQTLTKIDKVPLSTLDSSVKELVFYGFIEQQKDKNGMSLYNIKPELKPFYIGFINRNEKFNQAFLGENKQNPVM